MLYTIISTSILGLINVIMYKHTKQIFKIIKKKKGKYITFMKIYNVFFYCLIKYKNI